VLHIPQFAREGVVGNDIKVIRSAVGRREDDGGVPVTRLGELMTGKASIELEAIIGTRCVFDCIDGMGFPP
jgi:hypothetical protein